jgi:hypothetical protein
MKKLLIYSLLSIFFYQCTPKESKNVEADVLAVIDSVKIPSISIDTFYNNLARLIGGKDSTVNYKNNDWDLSYIAGFSKLTTEKINRIKADRLNKMTEWNKQNLSENNIIDTTFVFYPFSGGDFIHVNALYPNASEYFLVAREDVGELPNLYEKDKEFVNTYLSDIDTVLRDIYNKSYFITKNMVEDTKKRTLVNGMLPLILWAASVTDHEVVSLKYLSVSENGELMTFINTPENSKPTAVEIVLKVAGSNKLKKVTYLSCDISDEGFEKATQFKTLIANKVPSNTNSFVKSASYLMHYSSFSQIRNLVLEKIKYLVQDDTGIPIKYFNQSIFSIELFGIYEKPVKDFSESVFQSDLNAAFNDSSKYRGDLNFSLGYHWGSRKQNQMIAIKK